MSFLRFCSFLRPSVTYSTILNLQVILHRLRSTTYTFIFLIISVKGTVIRHMVLHNMTQCDSMPKCTIAGIKQDHYHLEAKEKRVTGY